MPAVLPTVLAVLLGLSFEEFYAETAMPEESLLRLLGALPLCLLPALAGEVLLRLARRRFLVGRPFDVRPYARWIAALPLPVYAVLLFACGWPKIVVPLGLEGSVLLDHVVVLLPYFLLLLLALIESARVRRPFRLTPEGPVPVRVKEVLGTVADTGRHLGLILVPLASLIVVLDLARDTPFRLYFEHLPLLSSTVLLLALVALALVFPLLFRFGMGLRPLVAGAPLRRRLEEMAANLGFRCRDILYWSTRRPVLNAAIVGVLPRFRYVILTEELCKRLTLDELGAVFAHEVGHGKRHHAVYYLLFSIAFLTLLVPLGEIAGRLVANASDGGIDPSLGAVLCVYLPGFALFWLVLFSALSRRFELEADVYGVESTADPGLFIRTLEKVARLGRIERRSRAPRHFSIEGRTDFLRRAFIERQDSLLAKFRRQIRIIRRTIVAATCTILGVAMLWLAIESLRGSGVILLELGRDGRATGALEASLFIRPGDQVARTLLAEATLYRREPARSHAEWQRVLAETAGEPVLERVPLLAALRTGWARALSRGRAADALVLVERARSLNRQDGEVLDAELETTLAGMDELTRAVAADDRERVAAFSDRPPRWLRRVDMRRALERVREIQAATESL